MYQVIIDYMDKREKHQNVATLLLEGLVTSGILEIPPLEAVHQVDNVYSAIIKAVLSVVSPKGGKQNAKIM